MYFYRLVFAVRASRAFDGDTFLDGGATVLVEDGKIAGIESSTYDVPEGCPVTDHGDATVLPGLIESHAHLVTAGGPGALDRVDGYSDEEIDAVVTAALQAQLASGVTTVRDLGDRGFNVVDRRDAQRAGPDGLPWIVASGPPITIPDGHCWYMRGAVEDRSEIEAALRERVERGVDVVKIMASGGITTEGTDVAAPQFSPGDLRLMVDLAHDAGLPVAAHAHAATAVDLAMAAGVETIEHASYFVRGDPTLGPFVGAFMGMRATDEQLSALAASGVFVCPTLGGFTPEMFANAPPLVRQRMAESGLTGEQIVSLRQEILSRMHAAGVRFVGGSDAGIAPLKAHGRYAEAIIELGALVGVVPTLVASTRTAAEVCGLATSKGRLKRGFDADLLVVPGDLENDLASLRLIRQVVLRGCPVATSVS